MRMRDIIQTAEGVSHAVPETLYHGTSQSAWESIQAENTFYPGGEHRDAPGFSLTDDWNVALRFAKQRAKSEGADCGVIIAFDGHKLAQVYTVEPYEDPGTIYPESEWVIWGSEPLRNVSQFIDGAEGVSVY